MSKYVNMVVIGSPYCTMTLRVFYLFIHNSKESERRGTDREKEKEKRDRERRGGGIEKRKAKEGGEKEKTPTLSQREIGKEKGER